MQRVSVSSALAKKVMLVDDDLDFLQMSKTLLETYDFEVDAFASVQAAVEHFKRSHVDAIICDVNFNGAKGGLNLYRELQQVRNTSPVLFAFATGEVISNVELQELLKRDNVKIFIKPFNFGDVCRHIRNSIGG